MQRAEVWPTEILPADPAWRRPYPELHQRSTVVGTRAPAPPARGHGVRRMAVLAGWAGLVVSVWIWFADTPPGSVDSTAAILVEAGRVTGMVAGYVLLVQVLLMSWIIPGLMEAGLSGGRSSPGGWL